jgi:protein-S-isoprenylcysteine O-methyltransferase Ste14
MPHVIWSFEGTSLGLLLTALYFSGWALVLYATVLIDHFDLFGMRQVVLHMRERKYEHHPFSTPSLYKYMRHPLYLGWFIAFWVTPTMTEGHLLFAFVTSTYIVMAVVWEERDLGAHFGDAYVRYQETTPKFCPMGRPGSRARELSAAAQR